MSNLGSWQPKEQVTITEPEVVAFEQCPQTVEPRKLKAFLRKTKMQEEFLVPVQIPGSLPNPALLGETAEIVAKYMKRHGITSLQLTGYADLTRIAAVNSNYNEPYARGRLENGIDFLSTALEEVGVNPADLTITGAIVFDAEPDCRGVSIQAAN